VRIINALFQGNDPHTAVPQPIDYLIDSATTGAGVADLAAYAITTGDSANGYRTLDQGVHSYVARVSGAVAGTTGESSVYTTSTNLPYLPKQYLTGNTYYTIVVAGIIPATGDIGDNSVPFVLLADDPFPGPVYAAVIQARFRLINAAPYTDSVGMGQDVQLYLTSGSAAPSDLTRLVPLGAASYQDASSYFNVDPGTYWLTLTAGGTVVAQQSVTLGAGEVRSLILQSTMAGAPSTANHIVTNLLDHQYTM